MLLNFHLSLRWKLFPSRNVTLYYIFFGWFSLVLLLRKRSKMQLLGFVLATGLLPLILTKPELPYLGKRLENDVH